VINEEGFHKASIARVARRMGVSPNLLVHYFKSKDAMVLELFDLLMVEYFEFVGAATAGENPGEHRIKTMLKAMFGMGVNKQLLTEKCFYALYYIGLSNKQISQRMEQVYDKRSRELATEIRSAMDNGEINPADPEKMTALVMALFEGFSFMANMRTDSNYFEEFGEYFYEKAWALLKIGDTAVA